MDKNHQQFIKKMDGIYKREGKEKVENLEVIENAVHIESTFEKVGFDEVIEEINVDKEDLSIYKLKKELEK